MNNERLKMFVGNPLMTIVDAMGKIDENAKGTIFIVDENNTLLGCLTDGDIRRCLLKNGNLQMAVSKAMTKTPITIDVENKDDAKELMKKKQITALPVVDDANKLVDVLLLSDKFPFRDKALLNNVPVVIMAGGMGTRLYPYTKILPKPLIPIGDTPIVERILDYFYDFGMKKFYMTVNYKKGMIKSYFTDLMPKYEIDYIEENRPLGTGGSLKLIEEKFDRPLFVANCDALILADYNDIYKYHLESKNDVTIISAMKNVTIPYGVIKSGDNGEILGMDEKPKFSYLINTGMYIINPELIDLIPDDVVFHMTYLVDKVMKKGGKIGTYPVSEDSFLDMGEFGEMKRMEQKLNIVSE